MPESTAMKQIEAGERLPDLALPSVPDGAPVSLRAPGRLAPIVMMIDGPECEACRAYLRTLAASADEIREWDGRVVVVVPGDLDHAAKLIDGDMPFPVLADAERKLAARTGFAGAAVLIADQWGELHFAGGAGEGHDLPAPDEIVQWARYLAVQCPECQGEAL